MRKWFRHRYRIRSYESKGHNITFYQVDWKPWWWPFWFSISRYYGSIEDARQRIESFKMTDEANWEVVEVC